MNSPDKMLKLVQTESFEMTHKDLPRHISLQHQFPQTFLFQLQVLFLDQAKPRDLS